MKKATKKILKKILNPRQVKLFVAIRNSIYNLIKHILRKIYSGRPFKLALINLMEDDTTKPYQVFRLNNENIYFKSWKNSYVGAILKEI